jgi:hypothetical protein
MGINDYKVVHYRYLIIDAFSFHEFTLEIFSSYCTKTIRVNWTSLTAHCRYQVCAWW